MSDKPVSKVPPVSTVDELTTALALRKRVLKSLNELTPELRKWVVACWTDDLEKANA